MEFGNIGFEIYHIWIILAVFFFILEIFTTGFLTACIVIGCGAFRNPPLHMAELFKEVFSELEFANQFKLVVFAIFDDHKAWREHNPEGNMVPFRRVFG